MKHPDWNMFRNKAEEQEVLWSSLLEKGFFRLGFEKPTTKKAGIRQCLLITTYFHIITEILCNEFRTGY